MNNESYVKSNIRIFKILNKEESQSFRQWAKNDFDIHLNPPETFHPVIVHEIYNLRSISVYVSKEIINDNYCYRVINMLNEILFESYELKFCNQFIKEQNLKIVEFNYVEEIKY